MIEIYPSLISANILSLKDTIEQLDHHVDGYHIDVMDFHFVPNLTFGPAFVNAIAQATDKPLHVHVMVDNPFRWVEMLKLREHDVFVFHYEALQETGEILQVIDAAKSKKFGVGIAINPDTAPHTVLEFLPMLDQVLVMSVQPGFSGQKFIPEVTEKLPVLAEHIRTKQLPCKIAMDGGIGPDNIAMLAQKGAVQFGIASAIFDSSDPVQAIKDLRSLGR